MIPDLEGSGEKKVVDVLDKKKKKNGSKENSLTLQQTQKALSGFRPSQPLFPASRKRFMNSVYSAL